MLRAFVTTLKPLSDLTPESVDRYIAAVQGSSGNKKKHLSAISVFVAWLLKKDRIATIPLDRVHVPETGKKTKERRALAVVQIQKLLDSTRTRPLPAFVERYGEVVRDEVRKKLELRGRERALVYKTAVYTGLRLGEIASLRPCHLELHLKPFPRLEIPGKLTKNDQKARLLLVPSFANELAAWIVETKKGGLTSIPFRVVVTSCPFSAMARPFGFVKRGDLAMLFDDLLGPFLTKRPVAVMARAALEYAFADDRLNALFESVATTQYQHRLTFAAQVHLLAAVVTRRAPSVNAAFWADPGRVGVSLASVYDKLRRTEPALAEALVTQTAARLKPVMDGWPARPQPVPGYRLKVLDGNALAGTDHRLAVLRGHGAAALPGMSLVVQDHATGLLTHLVASEDAYTNERALVGRVLHAFAAGDLVVADRNFCLPDLFRAVAARGAFFAVWHHKQYALEFLGEPRPGGPAPTGQVAEQDVRLAGATYRCVTVTLRAPTRGGDDRIVVLTNLPGGVAAAAVAEVYRRRWTLEATFLEVTRSVLCEVRSLGYPRAALLTFALALSACNALRLVQRALEVTQGAEHPTEEPSTYYLANELAAAFDGRNLAVDASVWAGVRGWSPGAFAGWLSAVAKCADGRRYRKAKRGPKTPVTPVVAGRRAPHRSTFRLLAAQARPPSPPSRP